jgi:hypothetical protein
MAARQCDEAAAMMPPAAAKYLLQVCLRFDFVADCHLCRFIVFVLLPLCQLLMRSLLIFSSLAETAVHLSGITGNNSRAAAAAASFSGILPGRE